jgi:hypothetical protein
MQRRQTYLGMKLQLTLGLAALALVGCATATTTPRVHPTVNFAADIPGDQLPNVASCNGLSDEVKRTSLFAKKHDVLAVSPLTGDHYVGARNKVQRPLGARVILAANPQVNAPWLERVAHCQIDMYAASGHSPNDEPLSVPGAKVTAHEVTGGYAVEITADSWEAAREIRRRAEGLR